MCVAQLAAHQPLYVDHLAPVVLAGTAADALLGDSNSMQQHELAMPSPSQPVTDQPHVDMTFARNLKRFMKQRNEGVTAVMRVIGASSPNTVYKYLNGGRPKPENLERLAEHYGVHPALLMFSNGEVDEDLLTHVLALLERHLDEHGVTMEPDKRAKITAYLYQHAVKTGEEPDTVVGRVIDLSL